MLVSYMRMSMNMPVYFFTWKNFAVFHCINGICQLIKKIAFMGYQYIGKIEMRQHINKPCFCFCIKSAAWFIKQQDFRLHGKNCRQRNQSFFSAGMISVNYNTRRTTIKIPEM